MWMMMMTKFVPYILDTLVGVNEMSRIMRLRHYPPISSLCSLPHPHERSSSFWKNSIFSPSTHVKPSYTASVRLLCFSFFFLVYH